MCWCAQLMIQCETRLASVLWRFQIKSTLHKSLFTTEFFSNLQNFGKRKPLAHILDTWTFQPVICPSCSPSHLHFWYNFVPQSVSQRRNWQPPGIGIYLEYLEHNAAGCIKTFRVHSTHAVFHLVSIMVVWILISLEVLVPFLSSKF